MDFVDDVVGRLPAQDVVASMARACAAARAASVQVAHVAVRFRPGHPEIARANKAFGPLASADRLVEGSAGAEFHAGVAPAVGDAIVVKRRVSAFAGSDLEVLLRGLGATTLVLGGISTSGVVLSTAREAADRDYGVVVLADCCADVDAEVHRLLIERLLPRYVDVTSSQAWIDGLEAA